MGNLLTIKPPWDLIVFLQENAMEEDSEDVRVLEQADPALQESLQSENVPGEMEGEQTWPTEEEMEEAEGQLGGINRLSNVYMALLQLRYNVQG